jgi:hypothetical protein
MRSHSPGQNNFPSSHNQEIVKLQKAQVVTQGNAVFGENNMIIGKFAQ